MNKTGLDTEALIRQFSEATTQQGDAVRRAVEEATLKALQGRELSLKSIKDALKGVTEAVSAGAAQNRGGTDLDKLLGDAVAGMDAALEQAVQANRKALQQMVDQGASLRETQLKKAVGDIEKMEDSLFAAVRKAAAGSGPALEGPWAGVLKTMQGQGTGTGALAGATVEQLMDGAQKSLKDGRALGLKASQAMLDSYTALVSGVLIGLSDALQPAAAAAAAPGKARKD